MNKSLIKLFAILGIIGAVLGLIFSFLPLSELAIFPASIGLLLGLIAYLSAKKQNINYSFARIVVVISLLAIIISVGRQLFIENEVAEDVEFVEKTSEPTTEELDKELNELEDEDLENIEDVNEGE